MAAAVFLAYVPRLPSEDPKHTFALTSSGLRVAGGSSNRRLRMFAVTQITASFLLLAGAGALMKTLFVLENTQPPFDTASVLAVNLPVMSYGRTPEQVHEFYRQVQRGLAPCLGYKQVSSGFSVPWRDAQGLNISFTFAMDGAARQNGRDDLRARFRSDLPRIFRHPGSPASAGPRFPRHRSGGLGTRGHHQSERGEDALSRAVTR